MVDTFIPLGVPHVTRGGVTLEPRVAGRVLTLRARGGGGARLAAALGLDVLPGTNEVKQLAMSGRTCWLRPDEWLVQGAAPDAASLAKAVGADGAVVDTSSARTWMALHGQGAREVLASCCPIDLRPRALGVGQCAQTLVRHVPVLLIPEESERYLLACRPSATDYVVRWLLDGMGA